MNLDQKISRSDSFVFNEIEGEIVMMNIKTGGYVSLNETGKSIWELLEVPKTPQEIILALLEAYEVSEEQCKKAVLAFLEKLHSEKAIIVLPA
jgi:hypothetical protein